MKLLLSLIILTSCFKQDPPTIKECEELSMASYKGNPKAAHRFKSFCLKKKIVFTHNKCQSALNLLIMGQDLNKVKEKHGKEIVGCFNKSDIKKFDKSSKNKP